jgi:thiol:disulfide interchange protein DsbD
MYRQRFSVQSADARVALGDPEIPPGKMKQDEFFGEMEIYDSDVTFTVPVTTLGDVDQFTVEATGQGCNEPVGICYPPVTRTVTVQPVAAQSSLPQSSLGSAASDEPGTLQALLDPDGGRRTEFLHPDEAFSFELSAMGPETLLARFFIEPGYYLYKDKFSVASNDPGVEVAATRLPAGDRKTDEYFGEIYAFHDAFDAEISLSRDDGGARTASFTLSYQGCAEDGICYPPIEKQVSVRLPGTADAAAAGPGGSGGASGFQAGYWPILLAFGSGLLLTFTPCVLPMIPILGGIIVGQGMNARGGVTRLRGGSLAAIYVLGTAVTYTAVGVVAGLTGDQLQAYFQNIWAIGLVAALLVLMALSMFGFYELRMPAALQTVLQNRATGLRAGAFGGVFLMGMLSALIVGACVSPILISILGLAIKRGDPVLGGLIMFAMALGMGLFLVAMGFGFGRLLPRAGPWMERVKHAFGVMLVAVAIYLLGAIPAVPVMVLWAALLIGTAFYVASAGFLKDTGNRRPVWLAVAFLFFGWGVLAAVGALQGSRDILRPVDVQALTGGERPAVHAEFQRVGDPAGLSSLMETAQAGGKPVMIDYYADWCVDCVRMERSTFASPEVANVLNDEFALIQVDVTDPNDPGTRAIKQSHEIFGPPAMLFFDRNGKEIRDLRRYGYMDSEAFLDHIAPLRRTDLQE